MRRPSSPTAAIVVAYLCSLYVGTLGLLLLMIWLNGGITLETAWKLPVVAVFGAMPPAIAFTLVPFLVLRVLLSPIDTHAYGKAALAGALTGVIACSVFAAIDGERSNRLAFVIYGFIGGAAAGCLYWWFEVAMSRRAHE